MQRNLGNYSTERNANASEDRLVRRLSDNPVKLINLEVKDAEQSKEAAS
jgi:hypothetical protein